MHVQEQTQKVQEVRQKEMADQRFTFMRRNYIRYFEIHILSNMN